MTDQRLRVAFDATSLLGVRTGVGEVTAHLLEALATRSDLDVAAYALTWRGRTQLDSLVPPAVTAATRRYPARATRWLWPRVAAPRVERWTGPIDVVHATAFVAPPSIAPVLLTIHDLTFARFPEMCTPDTLSYARLIRVALDRGATVHTYSDFVADEVRATFDLPHDRVVRVYPGLAPTEGGDATRGRRLTGSDRYILALATIEPRKNLPTLVRAFDVIADRDPDIHLAIGGPDGWGVAAFDAAWAGARHRDRVLRLGYVHDHDRRDLLAGAALLAYPSIYEGFGHPPLEAMRVGVPVVASSGGAMPEVLGDAALLPNPLDVDEIADALARALGDDKLRDHLCRLGAQRADRYSWPRAADELSNLYHGLHGARPHVGRRRG